MTTLPSHMRYASQTPTQILTTDVILLVGTRLNWMFNYGSAPTFAANCKFIQLDVAAEELSSNFKAEVPLSGDLQLALRHWNNTPRFRWQFKQKQWVEELQVHPR